mgnify:CR=1 FL=1
MEYIKKEELKYLLSKNYNITSVLCLAIFIKYFAFFGKFWKKKVLDVKANWLGLEILSQEYSELLSSK